MRSSVFNFLSIFIYTSIAVLSILGLSPRYSEAAVPALTSATLGVSKITLSYDQSLDLASVPSPSDFVLKVNGVTGTISGVSIDVDNDTNLILTISTNIFSADTVTIDYVVPVVNPIQDNSGDDAEALSNSVCANPNLCGLIPAQGSPYTSTLVGTKLYVNNYSTDYLTVVDTLTNKTSTILVGTSSAYSTLVGTKLYISLAGANSVAVVDTSNDTLLTTIPVGSNPTFSSLVGTKLYVSNFYSASVSVIDTSTDTVSSTIGTGTNPFSITKIGTKLYVNNYGSNNISVINTDTDTVSSTILVVAQPQFSILVGTKLYVPNYGSNTISIINTLTDTVIGSITVGTSPLYGVLSNTKLYVTNAVSHDVSVIDTGTDTVLTTIITGGSTPLFSKLVGTKLYVPNTDSLNVTVINTLTDTVSSTITVGSSPQFSTLVGTKLYLNNFGTNNISVIDTDTDSIYICVPVTITYTAGADGSISGQTTQRIYNGTDGTAVTATPSTGYQFSSWSDGSTVNPRTDTGVTSSLSFTATFTRSTYSSGYVYGCKDPKAINYQEFVASKPSMCEYADITPTNDSLQNTASGILGSGACKQELIITDSMRRGDSDGKISQSKGVKITQVAKLQTHINRILAAEYNQASGPIDGVFGRLTRQGVERLQTALNTVLKPSPLLKIDGIVGPFTRAAINNSCGEN